MIAGVWLNGWGFLIGLAWLAFWVLLIVLIVALIRGHPGGVAGTHPSTALRILEERYARGEIPREEFMERRSVLTSPQSGPAAPRG
jgi:putative membrane protein